MLAYHPRKHEIHAACRHGLRSEFDSEKNDQALPLRLKSAQRGTTGKNKVRISDPVLVGFAMGRGEVLLYHLGL